MESDLRVFRHQFSQRRRRGKLWHLLPRICPRPVSRPARQRRAFPARGGAPGKRGWQGRLSVAARQANVRLTRFRSALLRTVVPSRGFKVGKLLLEGGASWHRGCWSRHLQRRRLQPEGAGAHSGRPLASGRPPAPQTTAPKPDGGSQPVRLTAEAVTAESAHLCVGGQRPCSRRTEMCPAPTAALGPERVSETNPLWQNGIRVQGESLSSS